MAKRNRGRGEGTIYKRSDGSWRVQIYVDRQRISHGAKTKAECVTWLNQMQFQREQGFDYQGGKISLDDYLDQWLEGYKVAIRRKTHDQYVRIAERYIKPQIGKASLKDLRPFDVEKFYSILLKDGVGIRTIRTCHSVLHRALEKALGYGLIMRNPAHGVTLPHYRPAEMLVWDDSQVAAFLVAANESPLKALYFLAITTGMRQGEIFGLKWSDLHWVSGTLQVQRQVQRVPGQGWFLAEPKTKNGRRMIKLGEGTLQELRMHKESQQRNIAITGDRWVNNNCTRIAPKKQEPALRRPRRDSNSQPTDSKSGALSIELRGQYY
jgi:integrase